VRHAFQPLSAGGGGPRSRRNRVVSQFEFFSRKEPRATRTSNSLSRPGLPAACFGKRCDKCVATIRGRLVSPSPRRRALPTCPCERQHMSASQIPSSIFTFLVNPRPSRLRRSPIGYIIIIYIYILFSSIAHAVGSVAAVNRGALAGERPAIQRAANSPGIRKWRISFRQKGIHSGTRQGGSPDRISNRDITERRRASNYFIIIMYIFSRP